MIYIDTLADYGWEINGCRVRSCHMMTDGRTEELHVFAERIGLRRSWVQWGKGSRNPHYDLTESVRKLAVAAGAIEVNKRAMAIISRESSGRK